MLKEKVFAYLVKNGYDVQDVGGVELNPDDDFPQFAQAAALKVIGDDSKDPRAILICGGGQGMCMAANRFKGIRASVIWDAFEAKTTRMFYACQREFWKIMNRRGKELWKRG